MPLSVTKCNFVGELFMGTYEHRLDSKARLVLPAKIREKLGDVVVAALGLENCISLYSEEEWGRFLEKIKSQPFYSNRDAREFQRIMVGAAEEITVDGTGRILLPGHLRKYAGLTQEVVISGLADHVEIWDRERWVNIWEAGLENLSEIAKGMDGF
ncbi:MAG: division/cell wall cluster transcriptional repressor MraZ [Synergistaceae bacterium]|nr:division/cell wall cluster transcriptional repressor MraZ [Synergistaceae bacterium]